MSKISFKKIKERVVKIINAWNEGAPTVVEFRNTKKIDFEARIAQAQAVEEEIVELKIQLSMKEDERDDLYAQLDDDAVDIRKGVEGHKDFGDDSPLIGSMGFVRKSERKTGLTRKKKADKNKKDEDK